MSSIFNRFEGAMEGAVEGSVARLFRSRIHEAELQKRLERAIEENKEISVGRIFAPNRYEVFLHPEDFAAFASYTQTIERDLAAHALRYGQDRRFSFRSRPRVELKPSEQARKRSIIIKTQTVDNPAAPQQPLVTVPQFSQPQPQPDFDQNAGTAVFDPKMLDAAGAVRSGSAAFVRPTVALTVLEYGANNPNRVVTVTKDVSLGRGLDNDIVFEDSRVSRHHARLEFRYGQFLFKDLNSTNGTLVNSRPITQIVLSPGDILSLGGFDLSFDIAARRMGPTP